MTNPPTLRRRKPKARMAGSASVETRLRPENKRLLHWLDWWLATPDDRGESWWNEFEADLQSNRVTFQPTRTG